MMSDEDTFFDNCETLTYRDLYNWAVKRLNNPYEARLIIEEVMLRVLPREKNESFKQHGIKYFLYSDRLVSKITADKIREMILRRLQKEPLQHILGHYGFRYLDVITDSRALIPRPETEILVEVALAELRHLRGNASIDRSDGKLSDFTLLDVGTGSGIIGCSVVSECDYVNVVCTDISAEAISLAKENIAALQYSLRSRIAVLRSNLADAIKEKTVDVICSNPPYLAADELSYLDEEVKNYDPVSALIAGPTGFEIINKIIASAPALLKPGGALLLEIAPRHAEDAVSLAKHFGAQDVSVVNDLVGRERVFLARW